MSKSILKSKWLIMPVVLISMLSVLVAGFTKASFNDAETSNNSTASAWTSANWTQTSQADFNAGVLTSVNITDSSGDVKLASSSAIATNSATTSSGTWTNPTNAYADGGGYGYITSGSPSANEAYGGYGFSFGTAAIYGVRVATDAWTAGTPGLTTSGNAASNANGTLPWTNPANGYGSDNSYATASYAYGLTSSRNPSATANGTLPWTSPANAYTSNNLSATVSPTYGGIISKNPTSNASGINSWTNAANAYTSNNSSATATTVITSSNSTGQVRPTGNDANTAAFAFFGGASLWQSVNDNSDTTYIRGVTNGGGYCTSMITNNFSVPVNSKNITLNVVFRFRSNTTSAAATGAAEIKVGGSYYQSSTSVPNVSSGAILEVTKQWTSNPKSSAAWTVDEINGTDATNPLQAIGVGGTDFNPDVNFYQVYGYITYYKEYDQIYGTFAITDPGTSTTISKVEIGYESWAAATQKLDLYTSANGGASWSANHTTANLATADPNAFTYIDVTMDQSWTWTLLNDANFKVKMVTYWVNGTPAWNADALVVRVTYDDRRPRDQVYETFGVTDPGGSVTVAKVEVGYEAFGTATGKLDIYTSNNGGSAWSAAHTTADLSTSDPNAYTYVDVTSDFGWTWTTLNNSNLKVKVATNWTSGAPAWSLDALVVRVTYDDRNVIDQVYGTFGITGTTETITKVEVGYEAFAVATGKLDVYASNNGGSAWSAAHTTADLSTSDPNAYTYVDVTSDFGWTWTTLNNSNLRVKVATNWTSGNPAWSLDALVVRVTYTGLDDEQIRVRVSWDGGSNWSSYATNGTTGTEATYWNDFTSATAWTADKLSDANFKVSVEAVTVGETGDVRLDWTPVEVTYQQYATSGSVASQVMDTTVMGSNWDGLFWDNTVPPEANVIFEVRASDTMFLSTDISPSWTPVVSGSPMRTNSPAGHAGSAWTDPENAYADGTGYATISSGNPSGNDVWGAYGFDLAGGDPITQVRVRYDAWATLPVVTLRAAGASASGTTTVAPSQPAGTATNDVLIAFILDRSASNSQSTAPTGWQGRGYTWASNRRFQVFTAVAGKNGLTGTSWTFTGLTGRSQAVIMGYYNADTTGYGGLDTAVSVRSNASGTYGTASITTSTDNAMIVAAFGMGTGGATWSGETCGTIGALTEQFDAAYVAYCSIAVADRLLATAGPTGNSTATPSAGNINAGIMLALKPDCPQIRVDVSWDGGTTWSSQQIQTLTGSETTYWYDVTSTTNWTAAKLDDTNLKVRVDAQTVANAINVNVDWLPVEVTYQTPGTGWSISITNGNGRYKQWKATLTPDGARTGTPVLQEVRAYYYGG